MDRSLVRSFLAIAGGRFGVLIIGMMTTPILVRFLGSANYGDYAFITALLSFITVLTAKGGVTSGVRKFIVEEREVDHWAAKVFGLYFRVTIVLTGLAAVLIILYATPGFAARRFGPEFTWYFYLLAALVIADQFFGFTRAGLYAFDREDIGEAMNMMNKVTYGVVAISLVYSGWDADGAIMGRITGAALAALACGLVLSKYISIRESIKPLTQSFPSRELLTFNFTSLILLFLLESLYKVDILMLQPLTGSSETGFYNAALVVAEFLWFVPLAAQTALLHSMSSRWAEGKVESISETASKVTRYTLLFTTLLIIGLASLAEPFVRLYYGPEFDPAVLPLLILLPGTLGMAVSRPIMSIGHAKGNLRPLIAATGVAAMLNVVLNALLIPRYGMYGAAVATSIGYGSMVFLHIYSARVLGFDPLRDLRLGRILITGVITMVIIFPIAGMLTPSLSALLIVPPIGFAVFVLVAVVTGAVSQSEVESVRQVFKTRIKSKL